ncbi:MAG: zinc dependent phospholipase C family protein [Bacilli bacterium]|nr:zinc dependent phospholipase C family protein [Bacilli bacterium]
MPSYKTHAIHGEILLPNINKQIDINKEDLKSFCMGPDALILTDYRLFEMQHVKSTRRYFKTLIKLIKHNKLQDNSEVMAFLYGQLDHFILDMIMHPLIYYMTDNLPKDHFMNPHGIVENLIDDYVVQKFDRNDDVYYHKVTISDRKLIKLVNDAYYKVYKTKNISLKYSIGMILINIYDSLIRRDKLFLAKSIMKLINFGDVSYHSDYKRVLPYLNLNHELWLNPETGEESYESFDNLWERANEIALETIQDVNMYLYQDKKLKNPIIMNDTSFNTGLPCNKGQTKRYVKKYVKK